MFIDKVRNGESGIFLYGITPPKLITEPVKIKEIAERQIKRIKDLPIDGLILYDLQDESSRTAIERPFPFLETLDPLEYCEKYLGKLEIPKIIYRSVGKYSSSELEDFLTKSSQNDFSTVFVGAPSQGEKTTFTLNEAYSLKKRKFPNTPLLGGVTIPERHRKKVDEHIRISQKEAQGCSFFISQGVYDLQAAKDMLSDYYYHCREIETDPAPVIFTFTPCGSKKTLQFMKWLGINIPRWLENELNHSENILEKSLDVCEKNWRELKAFADEKQIPIGCNIESVAVRKVEVEASIELLKRVQQI